MAEVFTSESKLYVCRGRCPHRPLRVSENRTPCEFHTSNIQRAQTKRLVRRVVRSGTPILRPPEGRSDDGNKTITRTTKRKAFQARQRHLRPQRLFSPHSFLARQKRMGPRSGGDDAQNHTAPSAHPKHALRHTPYDNFHGDGSSHHRVVLSAFLPSKEGNREHPAFHAEKAAGI